MTPNELASLIEQEFAAYSTAPENQPPCLAFGPQHPRPHMLGATGVCAQCQQAPGKPRVPIASLAFFALRKMGLGQAVDDLVRRGKIQQITTEPGMPQLFEMASAPPGQMAWPGAPNPFAPPTPPQQPPSPPTIDPAIIAEHTRLTEAKLRREIAQMQAAEAALSGSTGSAPTEP